MRLLLLALAAVIAVSGCTSLPFLGGGTISYDNDIVVIRELSAVPQTIGKGQTLKVLAYVENVGDKSLGKGADVEGSVSVNLYDYCSGLFTIQSSACGGVASGQSAECAFDKMLPKETKLVEWVLKPSEDTKLTTKCTLRVAARYPYETDGVTSITFINPNELERQLQQGTFKPLSSTNSLGFGPIKANFEVRDQQPIPASRTSAQTPVYTPVFLQIENRGSGFLAPQPDGKSVIKSGQVTLDVAGLALNAPNCRWTATGISEDVTLIKSKAAPVLCEIVAPSEDAVPKELTKQLGVSIKYDYEFRKEIQVTVETV